MKCEAQDVPDPLETADLNAEVFSDTVHEICDFNEFYTVYMGMLNDGYLDSGFSITECRTLFELQKRDGCRLNEHRGCDQCSCDPCYFLFELEHVYLLSGAACAKIYRERPAFLTAQPLMSVFRAT